MDEQEFKSHADHALQSLHRKLAAAADDYGFQVRLSGGTLTVTFHQPPNKFVISANAAVQQMIVSIGPRSYKLDWDVVENAFVRSESGGTLQQVLEQELSKQLKEEVNL